MPTWSGILAEIIQAQKDNPAKSPFDAVRRKYMILLSQHAGRNVILYATNWTIPTPLPLGQLTSITDEDIQGLMGVVHGLNGDKLDLILHSPGGSAEATEALVSYLRTKFNNIRVIIPHAAMSAATMLACSADTIMMGKHSFIGPIDPQMILQTQVGIQSVPAQAILDQFEMAKDQCKDPKNLNSWFPILGQYGPALLIQCRNHLDLSKKLVADWLTKYMFKDMDDKAERAEKISTYLSSHKEFNTHSRHINRENATKIGLVIEELEADQKLQDYVLSIFHATTHTFGAAGLVKIVENHLGKAYLRTIAPVAPQQQPQPQQQQIPGSPGEPPSPSPQPSHEP